MTDDEVEDYVRHLWTHLPSEHSHIGIDQVRAVLDAEAVYYERRFGPIRGWRAFLRTLFGRGDPAPDVVEQARPEFEEFVMQALAGRVDITRADVVAVMQVEVDAGPLWTPPQQVTEEGE